MTAPARVSGPGALSQRTDGGQPLRHIADAKYGEDKANIAQQKAAPLANSADEGAAGPAPISAPALAGGGGPPGAPGPATPPQAITPFGAPSSRPDEHVTTGMQTGPAGPAQVKIQPKQLSQVLTPYFAADDTGVLQDFAWKLSEMGL
jgi:hypothetical protein